MVSGTRSATTSIRNDLLRFYDDCGSHELHDDIASLTPDYDSMIIAGWIFCTVNGAITGQGWHVGLWHSLLGTIVGLCTLLPAYAIGGMGAGDAKMMAAIGSWLGATIVLWALWPLS